MQLPQRGGYLDQRVGYGKRYGLYEISDRKPVWNAGVPDMRRQTCLSRCLHTCVVARRIACTRADLQQVWRSSHDDTKDLGRIEILHHADVLEPGYAESLAQAAGHGCAPLLRNHEVLHRSEEHMSELQ